MAVIYLLSNESADSQNIIQLFPDEPQIKLFCEEKFFFSAISKKKIPEFIIIDDALENVTIEQILINLRNFDKAKSVPILCLLSQNDEKKNEKLSNMGVSYILIKPYCIKKLYEYVTVSIAKIQKKSRRIPQVLIFSHSTETVNIILAGTNNKYTIDYTNNPSTFPEHVLLQQPDIVIIDEADDAPPVIKIIESIESNPEMDDIPVFLLSDAAANNSIAAGLNLGITAFFIKPFIIEIFFLRLSIAMEETKESEFSTYSIEKRKKELLQELSCLPPFPTNFARILSVISDKNSSASDVEKFVEGDKILMQKLLNIANSSYYRGSSSAGRIETSRQSITTLGFNMVEALTLVTGTNKLFPKRILSYGYVSEGLWHHSLATAVIAKSIANDMHLPKPLVDDLFLCGLFHDIGKTILWKYIALKDKIFLFSELGESNKSAVEKKFTGYSHAEIGEILLKNWKLPPIVQLTTKNHHQPTFTFSNSREVCIVNLANFTANFLKIGYHYRNSYKAATLDSVKNALDINDEYIEKLIKHSIKSYKEISGVLSKLR